MKVWSIVWLYLSHSIALVTWRPSGWNFSSFQIWCLGLVSLVSFFFGRAAHSNLRFHSRAKAVRCDNVCYRRNRGRGFTRLAISTQIVQEIVVVYNFDLSLRSAEFERFQRNLPLSTSLSARRYWVRLRGGYFDSRFAVRKLNRKRFESPHVNNNRTYYICHIWDCRLLVQFWMVRRSADFEMLARYQRTIGTLWYDSLSTSILFLLWKVLLIISFQVE